uniref:PCI domain-containing protein n=1 Tax=Syphacia muris TaxID=451379 RepID=A0A158R5D4_9BILA
MSVPDPDEIMDTHVADEPVEDNGFDSGNTNEIDDDFSGISRALPAATKQNRHALINRLFFIADMCPPLKMDALSLLHDYIIQETSDTVSYALIFEKLEHAHGVGSSSEENNVNDENKVNSLGADREGGVNLQIPGIKRDTQWIEATTTRETSRFDALFSEFKRQKEEGVKESTRRAMDELFQHQVKMGRLHDAVKLFSTGVREYCTTPKHVVQMLLSWIEVSIYLNQWHRVDSLVAQIERAISEAQESEASNTVRVSRFPSATHTATKNMRQFLDTAKMKVAAISALYRLYTKSYKAVAEKCIQIDLNSFNYPNLLSPKDIAVYGTLCALATFGRADLKNKVLGSSLFRKFLDSEPKLIDLLQKFVRGTFGPCLDIMEEIRDQLLLNLYLSSHLKSIYRLIRRRAIVQYFTPFAAADIRKMASVFRVGVDELEDELVELIECGAISARIDSYNKVLYARQNNKRADVYQKALKLSKNLTEYANGMVLHAALHEAQICVGQLDAISKGPRRRPAQGTCEDVNFGKCSAFFGRGIISRVFGSGRSGIGSQASLQSAEADSSNEKGTMGFMKLPKASVGANSADTEDMNNMASDNASEDVFMSSHNENSEENPPPIPFSSHISSVEEEQVQRK